MKTLWKPTTRHCASRNWIFDNPRAVITAWPCRLFSRLHRDLSILSQKASKLQRNMPDQTSSSAEVLKSKQRVEQMMACSAHWSGRVTGQKLNKGRAWIWQNVAKPCCLSQLRITFQNLGKVKRLCFWVSILFPNICSSIRGTKPPDRLLQISITEMEMLIHYQTTVKPM